MAKTMTVEEFEHAQGREILDDAKRFGEVVVTDRDGAEVVVVRKRSDRSMDEVVEDLRKEWDERLAVLNEPGARETMNGIFYSTPEEFAEAANAAEARRRGR